MSPSVSRIPGGQPSNIAPTPAQWDSPKVVTRKSVPNVDMPPTFRISGRQPRLELYTALCLLVECINLRLYAKTVPDTFSATRTVHIYSTVQYSTAQYTASLAQVRNTVNTGSVKQSLMYGVQTVERVVYTARCPLATVCRVGYCG